MSMNTDIVDYKRNVTHEDAERNPSNRSKLSTVCMKVNYSVSVSCRSKLSSV